MLKFDINIVFAIVNLLIFFVFIRLVLFKPIMRTMEKRRELIQKQFDDAEGAKSDAEKLKEEYQCRLDGVEEEQKNMIAKAQENAKQEYDKILERARTDADRVKNDARKSAQIESEKARLAVKEEIAQIAMETAEKVVGKSANAQTDSDIYNEFLNESSEEE